MKKEDIIKAIEDLRMGLPFSYYTIGTMEDVATELAYLKQNGYDTTTWRFWPVDTEEDAEEIKRYYLEKGMKPCFNGRTKVKYIFIL
ncbi:MAG: hypothetical protein N2510_09810 [Ignavibacteria bacterium]|nr:hypothetical protein [Ignavibacteria bacterium]